MVSTRPIISKFSIPFTNPLVTVPSAPITNDISVIFVFRSFSVLWQGLDTYHSLFSFSFTLWSAGKAKSTIWQVLFILLNNAWFGRHPEIR